MTSNRFFIRKDQLQFPFAVLSGEEHHHLRTVSRIRTKDQVWLFDEHGTSYRARVDEISRTSTHLFILEKKKEKIPKTRITLAQALLKVKKMDLIVQKLTELGVTTFIPMITSRTVIKIDERAEKKQTRWEKIVIEAAKQCGRSLLPDIQPPLHLESVINDRKETEKLFLSDKAERYLKEILLFQPSIEASFPPSSVIILVGPEGGWTEEEETAILKRDFKAVNLGQSTLRSETAAIVSTAMINHFWNT